MLKAPTERVDVTLDQLQDLAKLAPKTQAKGRTQRRSRARNFDLAAWIANSGLAVASEAPYQEGLRR